MEFQHVDLTEVERRVVVTRGCLRGNTGWVGVDQSVFNYSWIEGIGEKHPETYMEVYKCKQAESNSACLSMGG